MKSLDKKLAVAAVAASLGLSLGVPVGDALAADDPAVTPRQLSSDSTKSAIESKQGKFKSSIESKQGKFRPNQKKVESTGSAPIKSNNR